MDVQGILNRLRLNPNFESVLGLDVVRDRIVAQTRGKVPQQHATAVQRPHRVFRRLSRTVIGRCPIGHLARKQKGVLHMCSSAIRSNHTKSAINGRTFPGSVRKNCEGSLSKAADCDEWLATRVRALQQSRRHSSLYSSFALQEESHGGAYDQVDE